MGPTIANEPNPVRAWAVAVRLGLDKVDRDAAAVRCFISEDSLSTTSQLTLPELRHVSALQWNWLQRKKEVFLGLAHGELISLLDPSCQRCEEVIQYGEPADYLAKSGYVVVKEVGATLHPFRIDPKSIRQYVDLRIAGEATCDSCKIGARQRLNASFRPDFAPDSLTSKERLSRLLKVRSGFA